ncbi:MAG: hypothetical protein P1U46_00115 [Patescibacteria group bacterium]|nr:hypothetical protein [Patescibacteria group bacterium]
MEWFPAIICRLDEMLPPKISLTEGSCGQSLLTQEEREEINSCN